MSDTVTVLNANSTVGDSLDESLATQSIDNASQGVAATQAKRPRVNLGAENSDLVDQFMPGTRTKNIIPVQLDQDTLDCLRTIADGVKAIQLMMQALVED